MRKKNILYVGFMDLEKLYNRVNKEALLRTYGGTVC